MSARARALALSDVALVAAFAVLACAVCAAAPAGLAAIRVPLALPLALVLPGYACVAALFAPGALRTPERIVLSVAISIAATILSGIAVEVAGAKINASAPWVEVLAVVTLIAAAVALRRGHTRALRAPHLQLRNGEALALAGTVLALAAAGYIGLRPLAPPARTPGTAGLWLLEAPANRAAVCVSVINEQFHPARYRVSVRVAGRPARTLLTPLLPPGVSWSREVAVGPGLPAVHAILSRAGTPNRAYRRTALTRWAPYLRARRCG